MGKAATLIEVVKYRSVNGKEVSTNFEFGESGASRVLAYERIGAGFQRDCFSSDRFLLLFRSR